MNKSLAELIYDILTDGYSLQIFESELHKNSMRIRISGHGVYGYRIFEMPKDLPSEKIDWMLYEAIVRLHEDANEERRKTDD